MNNRKVRDYEDEDYPNFTPNRRLGFTVKTKTLHNFTVHLDEEIKDASYYSAIFDMLVDAESSDIVNFFISSPGGDADGMNTLIEGLRLSDASTCAILVGQCHSAASIFAMHCDEVVVTDSASMLVHQCRTGFSGKMVDVAGFTEHTKSWSDKIFRTAYEGFLTEEEITRVLSGLELWLDADQIRAKFEARDEYLSVKAEIEAAEKED